VAKRQEPLEVEGYLYGSPKNLVVGLRFKFQIKSGGEPENVRLGLSVKMGPLSDRAEQCLAGPNNVRLEVSVCGWTRKNLESFDSIIFTSSNTPLLIV
jgi:hypothetical protein